MRKKNLKFIFLFLILAIFSCSKDDNNTPIQDQEISITDIGGNIYQTITIGNQVWMAENLKTTIFNDGVPITEYIQNESPFDWFDPNSSQAHFQWAFTGDLNNVYTEDLPFDFYGAHYNFQAIQSGKLEIEGWRLPTQKDFEELINYVASQGHTGDEATVLKSEIGWVLNQQNGTNLFGFNVRPAGSTIVGGTPDFSEALSHLCTSDVDEINNTRKVATFFENGEVQFADIDLRFGLSIRLIKE